jgi:tRNA(fMet)-specific endonuclease VapC
MRRLWDSDTTSEFIKAKHRHVARKANSYLVHQPAFISLITRYELLRWLRAHQSFRLLQQFEAFCTKYVVLPIDEDIVQIASDIWADLHRRGQLIGDCDILIAATSLHHGLPLVTGNTAHFARIPGLTLEDWTKP